MAGAPEGTQNISAGIPTQSDLIPAWGVGMSLGECIADDFLATDKEMQKAAKALGEDKFKELFQGLMVEVTQCMGKYTQALKEIDEDEDNPAKGLVHQ